MMKSKLERGICLWLVIMIGSLFILEQPLLAATIKKNMITIEDAMGTEAKLVVDEDECWVKAGFICSYSITLNDIPGTLFSDQGEMCIYIVADLDEKAGAEGISFDNSKVKILAKQNDKDREAICKLEEDGKLLIKVSEMDREEDVNITLEGLQLAVDRTVPEGHYYLEASSADEKNMSKLLFKESVMLETARCGRIPFVAFFLDKKEYVTSAGKHNRDTTYEIEVSAYKNAEGTIMVPMKYAFNNQIEDVIFSGDVMWFTYGNRKIKLNMNTKVAVIERTINGNDDIERIALVAKPEMKNGRVYLAAEDVAKIQGYGWRAWQDPESPNAIMISGMC